MNTKRNIPKKAQHLYEEAHEYHGQRRVAQYKTRANRITRRAVHQAIKKLQKITE
jgi:hypothetical protein